MTYESAEALRIALEQRLLAQSRATGVDLERLRRRVIFERVVARLHAAEPGAWVLKGGMALEVRLRDDARLTKDIDLGLRDVVADGPSLRERLIDALATDPYDDRFLIAVTRVDQLMEDGGGHVTWRARVAADLAGRTFGGVQLDVSPRTHELDQTEVIALPNSLAFAGVETPSIEIVDVNRHAAEKFHGMLKDFGDRENTRVRDLVDIVILTEHGLIDTDALRTAVREVWHERDGVEPPHKLPGLPEAWPDRYQRITAEQDLDVSFSEATARAGELWAALFTEEN